MGNCDSGEFSDADRRRTTPPAGCARSRPTRRKFGARSAVAKPLQVASKWRRKGLETLNPRPGIEPPVPIDRKPAACRPRGGDHQSALAAARHRHSLPPCATNDAHHRQRARQVGSRRQGAPRRRHVSARPRQNCGAVDRLATLGRDPRQSLSGIPQRSPLALTATPRPKLTQPRVANTQKPDRQNNATAIFRLIQGLAAPFWGRG